MSNVLLPVAAFVGAVLTLIPLPSHWRARNYATISLVFWLFLINVIYGVNSALWNGNVRLRLLVWCDITTKLIIGASVALPAAAMCICKHLESVASGRIVRVTHGDKQRRMYLELAMCFLLPTVIMALHYVVQGHRFDIVEGFGCQPATYYSVPAVLIVWVPPLLLATVSMIFASLALYHFIRHRFTFALVLRNASSSITPNRYLRLMALAITEVIWQIALTVLPMYDNIAPGLRPWTTWADVHSDWLRVDQYYLDEFVPAYLRQLYLFFFVMPASSLLFFLFFGFGEQATKDYRQTARWIWSKILRRARPARQSVKKGFMLSSDVCLPSPIAHTTLRSEEEHSLPAYSPPSSRSQFYTTSKSPHPSLDNVTIPTIQTGELSPIDHPTGFPPCERPPSTHAPEHMIGVPITANQHTLPYARLDCPVSLPVPPRSRVPSLPPISRNITDIA